MYKKQMTIQKALCILVLCTSVLVFVYSLGIMTDLYDTLYFAASRVEGASLYFDMQDFNKTFLHCALGLIIASLLLFITNTNVRRRYYIGNVIAVAVNLVANIAVAIWAHGYIVMYKADFQNVDFTMLERVNTAFKKETITSTFWLDIHTAVFAIAIIANILLCANLLWKFSLMKKEQHLIDAGKGVAV